MILRSDLDHPPVAKRRELERVVQLLFEEFQASLEGRSASYRRTDLLVVVNHDKLTDIDEYWRSAEDRFSRELIITKSLHRPEG